MKSYACFGNNVSRNDVISMGVREAETQRDLVFIGKQKDTLFERTGTCRYHPD
jgi:hypothetical protein